MNKARTEFDLPADHQVHITWNWLLGFVEGDGSFSFSREQPRLSIQVTLIDKPVLVAINEFFGGKIIIEEEHTCDKEGKISDTQYSILQIINRQDENPLVKKSQVMEWTTNPIYTVEEVK